MTISLNSARLDTPLGPMLAIADQNALLLLDFMDQPRLDSKVARLKKDRKADLVSEKSPIIASIERELTDYFAGSLRQFTTPLAPLGSPFQKQAWNVLLSIPYGETRSYKDQATMLGKPAAYRAVANANGANQIAIVIPCHRIIAHQGGLGGYGGGIGRKQWLLEHEAQGK